MDLFVNLGECFSSIPVSYDMNERSIRIAIKGEGHTFKIKIEDVESEDAIRNNIIFHNMYIKSLNDDAITFAKNNETLYSINSPSSDKLMVLMLPRHIPYDQAMVIDEVSSRIKPLLLIKTKNAKQTSCYFTYLFEYSPDACTSVTVGFLHAKRHRSTISANKLDCTYQITRKNTREIPYYEWSIINNPRIKQRATFTSFMKVFS